MRLTAKKIEELLVAVLGEEGIPLIKELIGKENVSEFSLATKTKLDIKVVRRMLYIMYNHNLVSFTRKKDKQKGWYIYYWTLIPDNIKFNYFKRTRQVLERLKQRLEEETQELFFICPNNCVRLNFDQSMDFEFHCPECGELITQDNREKNVESLQKRIAELERIIEEEREEHKAQKNKVKARKKEVVKKKKEIKKKKGAVKNAGKKKTKAPVKKKTTVKKSAKKKKK